MPCYYCNILVRGDKNPKKSKIISLCQKHIIPNIMVKCIRHAVKKYNL